MTGILRAVLGTPEPSGPTELVPDQAIEKPSDDQLGLVAVAQTLSDLVVNSATPINIAIFGAWGSGKTSLAKLLEGSLAERDRVEYVYINAWKYSETPLRRHFLAGAGRGLGESADYGESLYSKTRTTRYRFTRRTLGVALLIAALALGLAIGILALAQLLVWLPDQRDDFFAMLGRAITANTGSLLISTSLLSPLLTFVVNEMKVELNEDEPSSAEQFDKRFAKLVEDHLPEGGRLVFFVDELDRARAPQMQEVLETLKTFLDQPGCVFVVAADQVVLEEAISKTEQVTVQAQGNPYYSGGSAYLDKVFQFQIHLPAIETPALTRFALDLVENRPGVWAELGHDRPDVVSTLVPGHVRSPRRVKVLLNNFVLATRVARSRLEDVIGPADLRQLAKLVCLRTEFPLFYRDVEANPSLVDAVTAHVVKDSARIADYQPSVELNKLAKAYADGTARVDVRLADPREGGAEADRNATDQLRDYLRRSRGVAVSNHALVFLRPPGSQLGLDKDIARRIEDAARNGDSGLAIAALQNADGETISKAIDLLLLALESAVGIEIANVVGVLLAVARENAAQISLKQAGTVLNALETPHVRPHLSPNDVESFVILAGGFDPEVRSTREAAILDRLSESDDWALATFRAHPQMSPQSVDRVRAVFAEEAASASAVALEFSASAPEVSLRQLWDGRPIESLSALLADPSAMQSQHLALAKTVAPRLDEDARWSLLILAIRAGAEDRLSQLQPVTDTLRRADKPAEIDAVLAALAVSPRLLSRVGKLLPDQPRAAAVESLAGALAAVITDAGGSDASLAALRSGVSHFRGVLEGTGLTAEALIASLGDDWRADWSEDAETAIRSREQTAVQTLSGVAPDRRGVWADIICESLLGVVAAATIPQACRAEIVARIQSWGPDRPSVVRLVQLFDLLTPARPGATGDAFTDQVRRYCLYLVAALLGDVTDAQRAVLKTQLPASGQAGSMAAVCIALYASICLPKLADEPDVILAAARLADDPVSGPRAGPYFQSLREPAILDLLVRLHDSSDVVRSALRGWLGAHGDQVSWAKYFSALLLSETTLAERKQTWEFIASLSLDSKKAVSIASDAALDAMTGTSGSLNDFLARLPQAFPGWVPTKKYLKVIEKAESRFADKSWRKRARQGLDQLLRRSGEA